MSHVEGLDGGISNFMPDIYEAARQSNGFVLELGCGLGTGSTLAILRGLLTRNHERPMEPLLFISVDIENRISVEPELPPWWHIVVGDSRRIATAAQVVKLAKGRHPAGLIFIDTDHTYEQMQAELDLWQHMAGPETVWLFHDTWMHGQHNTGMVRAIQEFANLNGWVYEDWKQEPHGLGRMTHR